MHQHGTKRTFYGCKKKYINLIENAGMNPGASSATFYKTNMHCVNMNS